MEFVCKSWGYRHHDNIVLGCCNGLLYLSHSQNHRYTTNTTLVVIHPLRIECYELPLINTPFCLPKPEPSWVTGINYGLRLCVEWSCGLGFDDFTNTFKMVCIMPRKQLESPNFHQVINEGDLCTMVHELGTDSWRKIPQAPSHRITGEGVFAKGYLHWLTGNDHDDCHWMIRFDIKTEEFELIKPPRAFLKWTVHLVEFYGEVGFVHYNIFCNVKVWILSDKGWVMHCNFEWTPPLLAGRIKVLGFWNEKGDVLMTDEKFKRLIIYNLKGDSLYEANFVGLEERGANIRTYQSSLFSTRYSIKDRRKNG